MCLILEMNLQISVGFKHIEGYPVYSKLPCHKRAQTGSSIQQGKNPLGLFKIVISQLESFYCILSNHLQSIKRYQWAYICRSTLVTCVLEQIWSYACMHLFTHSQTGSRVLREAVNEIHITPADKHTCILIYPCFQMTIYCIQRRQ